MNIFKNHVILRGFLSKDAEVPTSDHIRDDSYAVLTLCIESGVWNKARNKWIPQTARHTVLCPGPYFCGFTRGMKHGDYVEVEGELRSREYVSKKANAKQRIWEIRVDSILKLDRAEKAAPEEQEPSEFSPEEEAA